MVSMVLFTLFLLIGLVVFGPMYLRYRKNKKYPISEEDLRLYLKESDVRHEEKVRKQWVLCFFLSMSMNLVAVVVPWLMAPELSRPHALLENGQVVAGAFILMAVVLISALVSYHCAYRKRGTGWLWLNIIAIPFGELRGVNNGIQPPCSPIEWGIALFCFGMTMWFWVSCIRLRNVNAFRKVQIKLARKNKYFQQATEPAVVQ
jgi:MFS family permease